MKEFIQNIVDLYPIYMRKIALYERHLQMRHNSDMLDELAMLQLKVNTIESWFVLLTPDERFAFRQILNNHQDVPPAQRAAAILWSWSMSQAGETLWSLHEHAFEKIVAFAQAHTEVVYSIFSDIQEKKSKNASV